MRFYILLSLFLFTLSSASAQSARNDSLFYNGCSLFEKGKYREAIPFFEQAAQLDREEVPQDQDLESTTRQWIASCYYNLGDINKAREYSYFFYDQPPVDRALTKEARSYGTLIMAATDIDNAIFWAKRTLEEETKALGPHHYYTIGSYCNLAQLYFNKGDSTNCREYISQARNCADNITAVESAWKAMYLGTEANLEYALGNLDRAKRLAEETYGYSCGRMDQLSLPYRTSIQILFDIYVREANIDKANAIAEKTAAEYMALDENKVNIPELYLIPGALATFHVGTAQPSKGMEVVNLAISLATPGSEPMAELLYARGMLNKIAGNHEQAIADISAGIDIFRTRYPRDNSFLGPNYLSLGECYDNIRDLKAAEGAYKTALQNFRRQGDFGLAGQLQSLHHLGAIATRSREFKTAIGYLEDCIRLMDRKGIGSLNDRAFMHKERAHCENGLGQEEAAMENYRKAVEIYETNDLPLIEDTYVDASLCIFNHLVSKDPQSPEALAILNKLKSVFKEDNLYNNRMRVRLQKFEAEYLCALGQYEQGLKIINEAITSARNLEYGDDGGLMQTKFNILINTEQKAEALELLEGYTVETEKKYGQNSRDYLSSLVLQSVLMNRLGALSDIKLMNDMGNRIIDLAKLVYDKSDAEYATAVAIGARNKCYTHPTEAGRILRDLIHNVKNPDPNLLITIYGSLTDIERSQGNFPKAVEYAEKTLESCDKLLNPDLSVVIGLYNVAGNAFLSAGQLARAEDAFKKSLDMALQTGMGERMSVVMIYLNLANLYAKMGKQELADRYMENINRLSGGEYSGYDVLYLTNLVNGIWRKYASGQKEQCLEDLDEIEKRMEAIADTPNMDKSLPTRLRAMFWLNEGNLEQALKYGESALSQTRSIDNLALNSQIAFNQQDYPRAMKLAEECLRYVEGIYGKNAFETVPQNKMLGDIYLKSEKPAEATRHYRRAFNNGAGYIYNNLLTLTADQRADFWAANYDFFRTYLPWLCHNFETDGEMAGLLYDAMLFSNGLLLNVDKAIIRSIQRSDDQTKDLFAQLNSKKELLARLVEQGTDPGNLEEDVRSIEKELMRRLEKEDPGNDRLSAPTWQQVRKALPKGAAAVEFIDFALDSISSAGMAVIITRDLKYPVVKKLYSRPHADNLQWPDFYENSTLGNLIWNGIGEAVGQCDQIYFVPQGPLCSIAIEALPVSDSIFNDRVSLHRLSSTAELLYSGKKRESKPGATLYGGLNYDTSVEELSEDAERYPEMRHRGFVADNIFGTRLARKGDIAIPYLEGSRMEVDSIVSFIARTTDIEPVCKTWNDGTETSFKAMSGDFGNILHVSTHGFFIERDAVPSGTTTLTVEDRALQNSGLLMSGASNRYLLGVEMPDDIDDGILTAAEIAELDLSDVGLAVLSACETGLGEVTGDGVFGLQRGFKKAGAGSILMSLWKVDDDATCHLMTEFYRHWLGDTSSGISPMSKQAALDSAKESVRRNPEWDSPFYWAAFILLDALD